MRFGKAFEVLGLVLICLVSQGGWAQPAVGSARPEDAVTADVRDNAAFLREAVKPAGPSPAADDGRVQQLISKMTLREKVGQMTQLTISMIAVGRGQKLTIDSTKLNKAVVEYGVGSILNVDDEALTVDRWHEIIRQIQSAASTTRLRIPVIYGIDSIHGANYVQGSTLFPQPLAMAATWNPALALRAAEITAAETRAAHIPWNFSPVLDIGRQPLWSRLYETYGEDPMLARTMGVAVVRGYEGTDISDAKHVAACLKHYIGYSGPSSGRDRSPALIPEIALRQNYFPTFRAAVEAGAHTVMVNSGEVNGTPGHVNKYLLTDVLRGEMGFKGFVVSDWEDIKKLVTVHRVAANEKEATRMAVMAGIDMSMVPSDFSFSDLLYQLVEEGSVPVSRIDEAVGRILRVKFQLGLFEHPVPEGGTTAGNGLAESRAVSLQAAREAITLLKNERDILPLKKKARVMITGPGADSLVALNNGWTYTWQGNRAPLYPKDRMTLRQAVGAKVGAANVLYAPGAEVDEVVDVKKAVAAARRADVILLALGEAAYAEGPGSIEDLTLPAAQLQLAQAMIATGKPIVLVLVEGRPRIISSFVDRIPAIVLAYNPSNEGGQAIADVLFGDYNPSGRLPITYPRHPNALLTYDRKPSESEEKPSGPSSFRPQFEFGTGLSYTTFGYSNLVVNPTSIGADQPVTVSVEVKNTGRRAGKEVVQVYLRDLVASVTPAGKRLVRFAKLQLSPGESQTVSFKLNPEDLAFVGSDLKMKIETGEFEIAVDKLKARFVVTEKPTTAKQ